MIRKIFAALALAAALTAPAAAQALTGDALEAATREVASGLRCPVCQGVSIQDSPTELAREMKGVIRQQLADGQSPDQVRAYFAARYGEWVLLQPDARGFNLVVYFLPLLGMLLGGGVVVQVVRRWTRVPPADPEARLSADGLEAGAP